MGTKKTHFVFVEWEDHSSTSGDNLSAGDIHDTLIVQSSGIFVGEDKRVLKLSEDQNPSDHADNRSGFTILKKNIRKRTDVITREKG